jgi:hypothetical protein
VSLSMESLSEAKLALCQAEAHLVWSEGRAGFASRASKELASAEMLNAMTQIERSQARLRTELRQERGSCV